MFLSVLKLLKWLAKFEDWKYRSWMTNCIQKRQIFFLWMYEITKQIDILKKMNWTIFIFLPKAFLLLDYGTMYNWAEMSMLKDRFFSWKLQETAVGVQLFHPCPTIRLSALAQRTSVIRIKPCGFRDFVSPWFCPDTQSKAICAGPICVWHEMSTAIS